MAESEQAAGRSQLAVGEASPHAGVLLGELAAHIGAALHEAGTPRVSGCPASDVRVTGVTQDSRRVEQGDLFTALQGATVDGSRYATEAAERGAVAVLTGKGRPLDVGLPWCEVAEVRLAMAHAAALVQGQPTTHLQVIGITGTNGKTTTAHLLQGCLAACGRRAGVVGTVGYSFEGFQQKASHTSPEADTLQQLSAEMLRRGAEHLVMEVSSIALSAQRVAAVAFDVVIFTNLSQDHLDYHGSMAAYAAAKDSLFLEFSPSACVVNIDDPHGASLATRIATAGTSELRRVSASTREAADVYPTELSSDAAGITAVVHLPTTDVTVRSPLIGRHNVENLLCALAAMEVSGLDVAAAAEALSDLRGAPGRLERCDDPSRDDVIALVDYAHTPAALERALASVRQLTGGRVWCVFGCGGDRDAAKRGPMGTAVGRAADAVVVTNDNPRGERPEDIAGAIVRGLEQAGSSSHRVELDRRRAIRSAVLEATAGDVVLIAGKGHETAQIAGDTVTPFDDRQVIAEALRARREGEGC